MRGAIVGLGNIAGTGHLPAYLAMDGVRIVAIADITPSRLAYARALVPGIRTYGSYQELLAAERDLTFIDVATPPSHHLEVAEAAAARGLHVLCEKPLTTSTDNARRLLAAASQHQVVVFPCHNYKHAPVIKAVREALASGAIGEVTASTLSTFRTTHARGVAQWMPDWRRMHQHSGGGIAMDHGSHSFYLMFLFMGGFPTSVSAKAFSVDKSWDTEDNVTATFTFPRGFSQVLLTWSAGTRKVMYTLQGRRGAIAIDDDEFELVTPDGVDKRTIVSAFNDASHTSWFTSMFDEFRAAIDRRDHVSHDLEEAFMCCHLIERIYDSAGAASREMPLERGFDPLRKPARRPAARADGSVAAS